MGREHQPVRIDPARRRLPPPALTAARALAILKHEMETTMGMIGCPRVEDIDGLLLRPSTAAALRRVRPALEAAS